MADRKLTRPFYKKVIDYSIYSATISKIPYTLIKVGEKLKYLCSSANAPRFSSFELVVALKWIVNLSFTFFFPAHAYHAIIPLA